MTVADLLAGLARANVAAAVAVVVVLLLRGPARKAFGARAAYGLWLLPLLAAGAVLVPHPQVVTPIAPLMLQAAATADEFVASAPAAARAAGPDVMTLLFGAWIAGAVLMAGLLLRRQVAFVGSLGRLERVSGRLFKAERAGVGPAVVGVIRPRIVAPADFETLYGAAERDLILAHETAHLRAGDAAVNALLCAAQCLGWFNPLAHVAAKLLRVDQELACDAAVIGAFPAQRKTYAELLLKTQLFTQPLPLGCHWPAGAEHPLKERIAMLKSPLPAPARRALGLALVAGVSLAGAAAAWAAQPGAGGEAAHAAPGASERAMAQKDLAAKPQILCKPKPDRTLGPCVTVTEPMWQALPTQGDLMSLYPAAARSRGVEGLARVLCQVDAQGLMHDCAVLGVDAFGPDRKPMAQASGLGFEAAALGATRYYQAKAAPGDGSRVWNFEVAFSPRGEGGLWRPIPLTPPSQIIAPPPPDAVVTAPDWLRKPGPADVVRVYPAAAAKAGLDGRAVIGCRFSPTGLLQDCTVKSEAPDGAGFGAAALRLAEVFQARPLGRDGDQVGGRPVSIPFIFQRPGATPVSYAAPAPAASVITSPDWVTKPDSTDVARVYPTKADQDHVGGMVVLDCRFRGDGRLTACKVASETPPEDGFGAAALKLAEIFQAKPLSRDGVAVAGQPVRIPIRFMDRTVRNVPAGLANLIGPKATITRPIWIKKPTAEDIARLYPADAARQGLSGQAVLNCLVRDDGRLFSCGLARVDVSGNLDREPANTPDFGGPTLQLAALFQMAPTTEDGMPVAGGHISIPVRWTPPAGPALVAGGAVAALPPPVAHPVWMKKPDINDIARLYPAEALKQGLSAMVVVTCRVGADGRLAECGIGRGDVKVAGGPSSTATEMDFGTATLQAAKIFQMEPVSADGRKTAGQTVRIPVRWLPPSRPSAAARVTQPVWIEKPTAAELVRFYPAEAVKQNLEGMTTLSCGVDRNGRLNQCTASGITTFGAPETVREDFRKATLELAGFFRLQTQPPGGRVVIPIRWALPTDRAAKARLDALTG